MTTRHQVDQLAIIQRAVQNRRRDHVDAVCNRIDWMSADRKFCEERWNKVRHLKGVYSVEACADGAHIVFKGADKEILFETLFQRVGDALFTLQTHGFVPAIEENPVVEEDKDANSYW